MAASEAAAPRVGSPVPQDSTCMKTFPDSSFFKERPASELPSPAEIRALNAESGDMRAESFGRPSPVIVPSLGLFVKYGADVTVAEMETQIRMRELLQGQVPIPEVFGWAEDGGQTFIYMSLVSGDTLQARWGSMSESEREAVCQKLRPMVNAWRTLPQEGGEPYVGSLGQRPLNDIILSDRPNFAGPFFGEDAVQQFQGACGIAIDENVPVVFTHADICPPNILLTPGPDPKVAAVIDWGQAGWYPSYWENCKARLVQALPYQFDPLLQEEWHAKYVPMIMDTVDDEKYYHPWFYFGLSKAF
ncbi:phosphotransferase family protein [Purpureocillium lilacinum]|uniref:Phosphotransferase family protein n=1 Tax=Purpureocillium lilacinum TaxID=33203 RepID=A0A179HLD6_PURLI|nr:phosphotransferase family protein [Purpureocillium lilacinum]OAQ83495.1 phosphotransferase family protein [Purpureocillium lilacinum]OAQ90280.1 phosphotransferase family protein [Purpureocillium lilacinum]GJN67873.1 hypothetical protein PLICBS_001915 [Purpureocillium lilacinum]